MYVGLWYPHNMFFINDTASNTGNVGLAQKHWPLFGMEWYDGMIEQQG